MLSRERSSNFLFVFLVDGEFFFGFFLRVAVAAEMVKNIRKVGRLCVYPKKKKKNKDCHVLGEIYIYIYI